MDKHVWVREVFAHSVAQTLLLVEFVCVQIIETTKEMVIYFPIIFSL